MYKAVTEIRNYKCNNREKSILQDLTEFSIDNLKILQASRGIMYKAVTEIRNYKCNNREKWILQDLTEFSTDNLKILQASARVANY
jgi:hypothetical protein